MLLPTESAPPALVIFLGALVTPTVIVGFDLLRSVWLTYISLYYLWVVAPAAVCWHWTGSRRRVEAGVRRGMKRVKLQAALALLALPLLVGGSLLLYHLFGNLVGFDVATVRPALETYGLTAENPAGDLGALTWLTFLNPIMEEMFWRIFLFESLRQPDASTAWWRWWAPAVTTSVLYASYHVPVVILILPLPLVILAYVFLIGLGMQLQLIVERFGLVLSVGVHLAADLTASLIVCDVLWEWGIG